LFGLILAVLGVPALAARAAGEPSRLAVVVVYSLCLIAVYAASTAYHLVPGGVRLTRRLRAVDHATIPLMIAGTCTPVFWRAFAGDARTAMLCATWGLALGAIALRLVWPGAPRPVTTGMYVTMGWLFLLGGPRGFSALPAAVSALVLAGGATYTAGAVVYAKKKPDPFPRVFGFHEIWHLFVLGGSALHYAAIAILAGG
jgi:hemolysin III